MHQQPRLSCEYSITIVHRALPFTILSIRVASLVFLREKHDTIILQGPVLFLIENFSSGVRMVDRDNPSISGRFRQPEGYGLRYFVCHCVGENEDTFNV